MRAISDFRLEAGTSTFWCRARIALRIRASMSATGSVNFIRFASPCPLSWAITTEDAHPKFRALRTFEWGFPYQDDFETPGISPRKAKPRKHRRQIPNLRRYARGRPQILQRLCLRVENFGFLASLTRFAVVAKNQLLPSS